ncbi:MAG: hypothetical protein ACLS85_03565 [Coprobacillus cateniformis]
MKNGNFDNGATNWNIAGQNSGVVAEDGVTIGKSGNLGQLLICMLMDIFGKK